MNGKVLPADPGVDGRRRALLLGATAASFVPFAGCGGGGSSGDGGAPPTTTPPLIDPVTAPGSERSLPIVPLDPGDVDADGIRRFSLVVQRGTTQFRSGVATRTLGYNGALLGPALRLRAGEKTRLQVQNTLDEPTTVHWHGLFVPAEVDGGPHQSIAPGTLWNASFTVANPASTCWFHPHTHGTTGRQVVSGLAGWLVVDDAPQSPSALPGTWGVDDLALVLQDKRFTAAGQIDYTLTAADRLIGYTGDTLLVNGAPRPTWQAPRQWIRLRLLNGCNARTLSLRLGHAMPMLQVANEAGLLGTPVMRASITLAPGERAEVLVNFSDAAIGQDVVLYAASDSGGMGLMGTGFPGLTAGPGASEVAAMTMRVALPMQPRAMLSPPAHLAVTPPVVAPTGAIVRNFALGGGMMGSPFTINGRSFDIGRVDLRVPAGTVEVWQFFNATGMAHPMHVHGVRMSLLARNGVAPAVHEQGLRDTFVVESMQTVSMAVQTATAASAVPLMFHCHILEHEDAGMMGQFVTS